MLSAKLFKHINCTHYGRGIRCSHQKPRYIPKAASKMFYVRKPTPKDSEETIELLHRYRHYRTSLKSIHEFLRKWQETVDHTFEDVEHNAAVEAAEKARVTSINNEWNRQVAAVREARHCEEDLDHESMLLKRVSMEDRDQSLVEEEARRRVIEESSKPFIQEDDLDHEIEKVMATCSDYNFSIDTHGNIYSERSAIINDTA